MKYPQAVQILLRICIASVFFYAAVAATLQPFNWIGYIPQVFQKFLPATFLLEGFSLFQVILAIWLLSGWKMLYASILSAITLLAIMSANITQIDILFRDFAIFFAAIALGVSSMTKS